MASVDRRRLLAGGLALGASAFIPDLAHAAMAGPPVARVEPVTEVLHGVSVTDPYRWMENPDDPDWLPFAHGQTDYTRRQIDALPGRPALAARIRGLSRDAAALGQVQVAGDLVFSLLRPAGAETARLMVRKGWSGADRLLLDPGGSAQGGAPRAISFWIASPDGRHVAVGLADAGSEQATLRVLETASGRMLADSFDRCDYADPSWLPDGSGFFFTRLRPDAVPGSDTYYDRPSAWLHRLGAPPDAALRVAAKGLDPAMPLDDLDFPVVLVHPDAGLVTCWTNIGVDPNLSLFVAALDGVVAGRPVWRTACRPGDEIGNYTIRRERLYLMSHKGAPRSRLLSTSAADPSLATAKLALAESELVLRGVLPARDGVYVEAIEGGRSVILRLDPQDRVERVALPFEGMTWGLTSDAERDGLDFFLENPVRPRVCCHLGADLKVEPTALTPPSPVDPRSYRAQRVLVTARDGTAVPLSIYWREGVRRDGSAPLILNAYGAYGVPTDLKFSPYNAAWLDLGGVVAWAHVRGGGDFGESWHLAGKRATKPNSWHDAIDCAEWLIAQRWTSNRKLAVQGVSAGGIVVGRFLTERPDLAAVAISKVGSVNVLRLEFTPSGPGNAPEFGSLADPDGFKALLEMDALQHVRDGVAYPAVLLTAGANDPRVPVWAAAKFAARLQAATASSRPVLLRVAFDAGHGIGSSRSQVDEETADIFAFILWQTGDPMFQPR
jgi:prolyl oligopeptidase